MFNFENLATEFPLRKDVIYLNHAAVSPWPRRSVNAIQQFADENMTIGSLNYPQWLETETKLRDQIRQLINAKSKDDIALLKNTSEALSVVAYGLNWNSRDNIVISNEEFPSNRIVWESLKNRFDVTTRQISLNANPNLTPEQNLIDACDKHTKLLSVSSIQYASGFRLELEVLGEYCRQHNILFCVDAIQSIGAVEIDVQKIGADFVMADGHKWMLGPEGIALFYSSPQARDRLQLNQYGWHMVERMGEFDDTNWSTAASSRRFECGSPNMLGIHALSASLSILLEIGMKSVERQLLSRSEMIIDAINNNENYQLLSHSTPKRYGGIVTFKHLSLDSERLLNFLSNNGIFCAKRGGGIRFSPHFYTPLTNIRQALSKLAEVQE